MVKPRVAVIGLGSMGLGAARSLLREGFEVAGCDVSPDALERFSALGGESFSNAGEASRNAEAVRCMVVNAQQTETVLFGEHGAARELAPDAVLISSATMAPDDARQLAAKAAEMNLHYLDAPISGGTARAATGQLTVMASGTDQAFSRAQPVLDAIAETVYELGDSAGTGAAFKIVNQVLAGVHIAAACEAITLASKVGLDLRRVYEVITASAGNSWMFENRVPHILDADYEPRSAVNIFTKDLGIAADLGRRESFPLTLASTSLQMFIATAAAGMGRDDDSSVARLIARITGVELPQPVAE